MKRSLVYILILVLLVSFSFPIMVSAAEPVVTHTSIVSDTNVKVVGVFNKYYGPTNFVATNFNAVRAAEPKPYPTTYPIEGSESMNSTWDTGAGTLNSPNQTGYFQNTNQGADWIWETARAEDPATVYSPGSPLYDDDASYHGRVVVFEKTFNIPGDPQYATLHIAADNCYEVWINGTQVARSDTAFVNGWQLSDLHQTSVDSEHWQEIGHYTGLGDYLIKGTNVITIIAGNEYYPKVYAAAETNNATVPPWMVDDPLTTTKNEYVQRNPGALIFKLDLDFIPPPVPELPAGALLGLGLAAIGGFVIIRRQRITADR